MKKLVILAAVSLCSIGAMADTGPYVGGGLGISHGEFNDSEPYETSDGRLEADAKNVKLFAGYRFSEYIAAEIDFGYFSGDVDSDYYSDYDGTGVSVSILPTYPVTDSLDVFVALSYGVADVSYDDSDYDPTFDGFGVGVGVTKHFDSMFVRGSINTSLSNDWSSETAIGAAVDIGFKF